MDIEENDCGQQALTRAKRVRSAISKLSEMVASGTTSGPFVDRLLVTLLADSRRLLDYISPLKSAGEIHGLPKACTEAADRPEPIVFRRNDPSIDFGPWWMEKTGRIHGRLFDLVEKLDHPLTEIDSGLVRLFIREIQQFAVRSSRCLADWGQVRSPLDSKLFFGEFTTRGARDGCSSAFRCGSLSQLRLQASDSRSATLKGHMLTGLVLCRSLPSWGRKGISVFQGVRKGQSRNQRRSRDPL